MKKIRYFVVFLGLVVGVGVAQAMSSATFLLDTRQSVSSIAQTGLAVDFLLRDVWLSNVVSIDPEMMKGIVLVVY